MSKISVELHQVEMIAPNEEDEKMPEIAHQQETAQGRAAPRLPRDRQDGSGIQMSGVKTLKDAVKPKSKRKGKAFSDNSDT